MHCYSQSLQWRLLPNSPGTTGISRFEDTYFINENFINNIGHILNLKKLRRILKYTDVHKDSKNAKRNSLLESGKPIIIILIV